MSIIYYQPIVEEIYSHLNFNDKINFNQVVPPHLRIGTKFPENYCRDHHCKLFKELMSPLTNFQGQYDEKINCIMRCFKYLAIPVNQIFMIKHPKFLDTVINKTEEFQNIFTDEKMKIKIGIDKFYDFVEITNNLRHACEKLKN